MRKILKNLNLIFLALLKDLIKITFGKKKNTIKMIYSKDHNFLLIKNQKVGGTSLEVELSKILPENSIVTPISPPNINHVPRNHEDIFYNHISYSEIKKLLDIKNIMSYVVVRNPYNQVLSHFFYNLHLKNLNMSTNTIKENTDLSKKVNVYFKKHLLEGTHKLYTENNKIAVNKVLYYENGIEDEINKVLITHKIKPIKITTFEKSNRPGWATYQNIFNRDQIDIINNKWAWEFENLEYDKI